MGPPPVIYSLFRKCAPQTNLRDNPWIPPILVRGHAHKLSYFLLAILGSCESTFKVLALFDAAYPALVAHAKSLHTVLLAKQDLRRPISFRATATIAFLPLRPLDTRK